MENVKIETGDSGCLSNMGSEQIGFETEFNVSFVIKHDKPLSKPYEDNDRTSLDSDDFKRVESSIESNEFLLYINSCLIKWFCIDFTK